MTRHSLRLLIAVASVLVTARPASAVPIAFDVWYEFSFTGVGVLARGCSPADPLGLGCVPSSGTPTVFVGAPAWTFAAAPAARLRVTDAFLRGDAFQVFDFGVPIGATPLVPAVGACGDDPVPCFADPLVSHAVFALGPGLHSLEIRPTASPFSAGAAYFRIEAVPEPATMLLLGGGLVGLAVRMRRHRKS